MEIHSLVSSLLTEALRSDMSVPVTVEQTVDMHSYLLDLLRQFQWHDLQCALVAVLPAAPLLKTL